MLLHQLLKNHTFSSVIQKHFPSTACLLENTIGKTLEAEHIDIQDSLSGVHFDYIFLCLHSELFRDDNIVQVLWIFHRFPDDLFTCIMRLANAGAADDEL